MVAIVNDKVYEFLKNELREKNIIIDINDDIFQQIIELFIGTSNDILLDDDSLEYDNLRLSEFDDIPGGKWLDNNGNIIDNDNVYIHWYNFDKYIVDDVKEYCDNKLSVFAEDYGLFD